MYYNIFFSTYSISSAVCFVVDYFYPKTRVKPESKKKVVNDYLDIIPLTSLNLLLSYPVFYYSEKYLEENNNDVNIPLYLLYWLTVADIVFYTMHYLHHCPQFYKYIHCIHHKYRYTYGVGAIYAHPIDHYTINLLSTFLPIYIYPSNELVAKIIIIFSTLFTVIISHGGFKIFNTSHLKHHLYYKINYGLFLCDTIMKTN